MNLLEQRILAIWRRSVLPPTLQSVADEVGCSRERVRQLLQRNGYQVRSTHKTTVLQDDEYWAWVVAEQLTARELAQLLGLTPEAAYYALRRYGRHLPPRTEWQDEAWVHALYERITATGQSYRQAAVAMGLKAHEGASRIGNAFRRFGLPTRGRYTPKPFCKRGHQRLKSDYRKRCKTCLREYQRRYYQRRKVA